MSELVRLNKYIADCGAASRRRADALIADGSVIVNGKKVYELGLRVDPSKDRVSVRGKPVKPVTQKVYYIFHKPKHVLTTMSDPEGRPTVADYFRRLPVRVFPVGRLDWDTEGMILLTNDGEFAEQVNHPRHEVTKTYIAKLNGHITDTQLDRLKRGLSIPEGGRVRAVEAERIKRGDSDNYDWVKLTITEGKNRQIHKMMAKVGFDVVKLQRVAIGKLRLGQLERGAYAELTYTELLKIFESPVVSKFDRERTKNRKRKPQVSAKRLARDAESKKQSLKV